MCIDSLIGDDGFSRTMILNLSEEEKGCTDIPRLFAIITVALGLLRPFKKDEASQLFCINAILRVMGHS